MNIQITNINIRYQEGDVDGVQVYFTGNDEERSISLNGYVPLTTEEYVGNETITELSKIIKQKINEKLNPAE